jgi:hypothetical protein
MHRDAMQTDRHWKLRAGEIARKWARRRASYINHFSGSPLQRLRIFSNGGVVAAVDVG